MKTRASISLILLTASILWFGCTKDTIEMELTGTITGNVQNSTTGEGMPLVSITTNPGTDAILTGSNGEFTIKGVPTGNYTVQAQKDDFETKTVKVSVKDNRTANAQILMSSSGHSPSSEIINAEVTFFETYTRNDSSFVDVEFLVRNTSDNASLSSFEVYFKVFTPENTFFSEFEGDTLRPGQQAVGEFTKYIRQFQADSVTVSGTFAPDN